MLLAVFAVAIVLALAIRAIGGTERGPRFAGLAVPAAALFGIAILAVGPLIPPIFALVLLGGLVGFAIDLAERPPFLVRTAVVFYPALCLAWFGWAHEFAVPKLDEALALAALWAGGAVFLWRIERAEAAGGGLSAAIMVTVAAGGVAAVAGFAEGPALAVLAAAVAAAAGGLVAWGTGIWLVRGTRGPFGIAALLGGAGALVAIAQALALTAPRVSKSALAVIALVAFTDLATRRIKLGGDIAGRIAGPPLFAAIAAIPVLVAVAIAYLTTSG